MANFGGQQSRLPPILNLVKSDKNRAKTAFERRSVDFFSYPQCHSKTRNHKLSFI